MVLLSKREEVDLCPNLPDFKSFFGQVPPLGRRLRVACPCTGVHACGYALQEMSVAADTNNVFDLEDAYWFALHKHLTRMGMQKVVLNLGKTAGDLLKVDLDRLELPVDCLISGPPCPPWAGPGNKKGLKDKRAQQVFVPWAGPGNISDSEEGSEDELSDVGGDSIEKPSHYHSDTSEEGCGGHKASRHCMDLK